MAATTPPVSAYFKKELLYMRADIEGATQAVGVAAEFDWSWTVDDLPIFAAEVGWDLSNLDQRSPILTTNLEINRTDAMAHIEDTRLGPRPLNGVEFYFSDVVLDDPSVKPLLAEAFDALAQRVFEIVGQRPTGWWLKPSRGLRWDLPNMVLQLSVRDHSGDIELINPAYQVWRDEIDKRLDQEANPDLDSVWNFE